MRILTLSLFSLVLLFGSCKWKTTKQALKHGEELKASIESFEKNRVKLSDKLVESLEDAAVALKEEDPNLPKVSKDFEKEWTSIQNRYKKLKKNFSEVGENSNNYFGQLDELSNNITKESLKQEELAKNRALKVTWDTNYKEAEKSINRVTEVLEAGNDFHMVLVASSIRQKLEQNVGELAIISQQAKALLNDLQAFTQAGRDLVEG